MTEDRHQLIYDKLAEIEGILGDMYLDKFEQYNARYRGSTSSYYMNKEVYKEKHRRAEALVVELMKLNQKVEYSNICNS